MSLTTMVGQSPAVALSLRPGTVLEGEDEGACSDNMDACSTRGNAR